MRELSDVNQLRDATETATDRLVRPQRRRTSCTPTAPLGPESVSSGARPCLPRLKIDLAAKIELGGIEGRFARTALDSIHARHH